MHRVSTRKVDDRVGALGVGSGISKSEVSRSCTELDRDLGVFRNRPLDHVEFHRAVTRALLPAPGAHRLPPRICLRHGDRAHPAPVDGAKLAHMAITTLGSDSLAPPGVPGCWCCGDRTVQASLVRLGQHPEVGVCFRCVNVLGGRKREIQRRTRSAPPGLSGWRRVQYRAGFGRC